MKTILVDFTRISEKSGFGEIADNYILELNKLKDSELHFVFLVKQKYKGIMGEDKDYVTVEHLDSDLKNLKCKIDLWHTTDQLFIKRRHMKGMKNILTVHDLNFLVEKKGIHRIKSLLKLRWFVRRSDCITVISNYVKDDLLAHVSLGDKPLYVIYNGISDIENKKQDKPAFITDDTKFFFTIGQTRWKKNFQVLIPMMRYLPEYKLYICGQPYGKFINELKRLKDVYHAENVIFTGAISNREKFWMYAHCEAFVFPSMLEGFGLPVLEAMRFGTKVFASKYTSLPEVCQNHATYFSSYNPEDMAKTVREGIRGWKRNSAEAIAAKEYSLQFSYDKYATAYLSLYKSMLGMK